MIEERDPDINVLQEHGRRLLRNLHSARQYQIAELWALWNMNDYNPWLDHDNFRGPWHGLE